MKPYILHDLEKQKLKNAISEICDEEYKGFTQIIANVSSDELREDLLRAVRDLSQAEDVRKAIERILDDVRKGLKIEGEKKGIEVDVQADRLLRIYEILRVALLDIVEGRHESKVEGTGAEIRKIY